MPVCNTQSDGAVTHTHAASAAAVDAAADVAASAAGFTPILTHKRLNSSDRILPPLALLFIVEAEVCSPHILLIIRRQRLRITDSSK